MYCPNCGTKVEETDRYCEQCGAPLQNLKCCHKNRPEFKQTDYQENSYSTSYGPYDNGYNGDVKGDRWVEGLAVGLLSLQILLGLYTVWW
jgi:hypothetical protein